MTRILFVVFLFVAIILSSCEKCQTCRFSYTLAAKSTIAESEDRCGTKKELDEMQKEWEGAAEEYGVTAECIRK
ncbi:MAG: hypothetical protein KKA07_13925 [Bacteroidetes bacterium]|nr:hypothetical protein [Bacteroidota bacterium]MBU1720160.1 hypothetical protein [Bacteroidota bacterium]